MNENDNKFNLYLNKIDKAFESDPNNNYAIIKKYADMLVVKEEKGNDNIKIDSQSKIMLLTILICFIILMFGFLNINSLGIYFAGAIFFFAGLFIGLYVKGFGLIFLISHGMTGLMIMTSALLKFDFLDSISPILSDGFPSSMFFMITSIILFYVLGLILTILHNFTKFKEKKFATIFPISCFGVGLLICGLFPYIFKFLN